MSARVWPLIEVWMGLPKPEPVAFYQNPASKDGQIPSRPRNLFFVRNAVSTVMIGKSPQEVPI